MKRGSLLGGASNGWFGPQYFPSASGSPMSARSEPNGAIYRLTQRGAADLRGRDVRILRRWEEAGAPRNAGGSYHGSTLVAWRLLQVSGAGEDLDLEAGVVLVRLHFREFGGSRIPLALEISESERLADNLVEPGPGAGRRPGTRNRRTREAFAAVRRGLTPLEYLMAVYRDPAIELGYRLDAAKAAAPYLIRNYPRSRSKPMPTSVRSRTSIYVAKWLTCSATR